MSSASTPRSTRSASPPGDSPNSNILTPGQKIKAMMAKFDSDSESDNDISKKQTTISKLDFGRNDTTTTERRPLQSNDASEDSDDADDIVRPKGRMAARMQGAPMGNSEPTSAFSRLSNTLRAEREEAQKSPKKSPTPAHNSSDDDLPVSGSKRRNNGAIQRSPTPGDSPARSRADSPLFVSSPAKKRADAEAQSDEDAHSDTEKPANTKNARFLELVAQKRKEREERERVEAEEKAARRAKLEQFSSDILSGEESEADDPGSAQKLSQKARQPRKASKKALEEMSRETQRMSRNMQLAHQAQTKKKITKESLFARFNFMQPDAPPAEPVAANSSSAAGSQNSSDIEGQKNETPRTSPVLGPADSEKPVSTESAQAETQEDQQQTDAEMTDLPSLEEAMANTSSEQEKSTSIAAPVPDVTEKLPGKVPVGQPKEAVRKITPPSVRVLMSRHEVAQHQDDGSDSDELEVITSPAKCRRIAAFENLPSRRMQESSSMTKLKALAHLTSPNRKMSSMSSAELSASLLYKARQQAAIERRERIEELRAKGVVIETAEERAAMEDNVEDLVAKARLEADEIAREERAARKKAKGLDDDEEEDDDDYTFSGSDEDASGEEEEEEDEKEDENATGEKGFFEQEADEADESSGDESETAVSEPEVEADLPGSRRKRRTRVVSDEDDEDEQQPPSTPVRPPSHVAHSVERPQFPGMETPNMSLGLTQAFAGTLADDASQPGAGTIPFSLPDPGRPVPQLRAEDSEILVKDSQEQSNEPEFMPAYTHNVNRVSESPAGHGFSQYSQLPDPTQDEGFVFSPFDPSKRFRGTPPVSTIDTVIVGQSQSPVAERKGRQLRRGRAANLSVVEEQNEGEGDFEIDANAFNVMKSAAKKKKKTEVPYDRKTSKAKGVVDEAAEESEDEYAGLGGASDDSEGEEDVRDLQMINDNSGEVVDEKQLAALNASHQRNRDEKDVAKLLKDITTGALRRRRGAADDDLDLDDSDDERVARRREKQREFARMRKALLADDKVGALAENPKKAAFFKAIEDREDQDDFELEFLEEKESASQGEASQDADTGEDSKKRKRPLEPSTEDATNRPPPNLRRTAASAMSKKPATLAEIRETLSFLTETPEYDSFQEDASVEGDEDVDQEDDNNTSGNDEAYSEDAQSQPKETFAKPSNPRRTRGTVIDRLALLRQASSNSATTTTSGAGNNKMAFHNGGNSDGPIGFRPPQLLRRVTSGSSSSTSTTSGSSSKIPKPAASGPKKGGAVNSYTAAREQERERQLRAKQRNGGSNIAKLLNKHAGGGLGALAGKGQWD